VAASLHGGRMRAGTSKQKVTLGFSTWLHQHQRTWSFIKPYDPFVHKVSAYLPSSNLEPITCRVPKVQGTCFIPMHDKHLYLQNYVNPAQCGGLRPCCGGGSAIIRQCNRGPEREYWPSILLITASIHNARRGV
jgi:hypothetical protein